MSIADKKLSIQKVTDANDQVLFGGRYEKNLDGVLEGVSFTPWFKSVEGLEAYDNGFSYCPEPEDLGQVGWSL